MKTKQKSNYKKTSIVLFSALFIILLTTAISAKTTYWLGDNSDFSIGSDTTFFIDTSASRVGIGTATPDQQLQVVGNFMIGETDTTGGILYLYGSTAEKYSKIYTTSGHLHIEPGYGTGGDNKLYLNYYSGGTIYFGTGATGAHSYATTTGHWNLDNTLYVSGAGRVGIGDSSPDYLLDVEGTGTVGSITTASGIGVYASGVTYGAYGLSSSTTGIGVFGYNTGSSGVAIYGQTASSSGYSGYFTGGKGLFYNGGRVFNYVSCAIESTPNANTQTCPSGKEAVGGGCDCGCGDLRTIQSRVTGSASTPTGWYCQCVDCNAVRVYAVCCGGT